MSTVQPAIVQPTSASDRVNAILMAVLPPVVAILFALVIGDALILFYGHQPAEVWRLLLDGTWGNGYGFGQVLYKATTLTFTGLAVSIGLRAGLFNIGAESQLAAGGFAAAVVGLLFPASFPGILAVLACTATAAAAGGIAGSIPGILKARFGAHEVIVTIMLNFIILALLNYTIANHLHVPETLHTPAMRTGFLARLADIMPVFHGSAANLALTLALALALALWFFLFRTRAGYELRAVGLQPKAAEYGGVSVARTWVTAMMISGAAAGVGGINYVLGYKHYYEEGFAGGAGFLGIAVALVGRNHPIGVVLAALFFATLSQGGLAIHAEVPKQIVDILQAIVIIAVAVTVPEVRRLLATKGTTR